MLIGSPVRVVEIEPVTEPVPTWSDDPSPAPEPEPAPDQHDPGLD